MASIRHRRAIAQGLHRPSGTTVGDVVRRQCAVQAQDYRQAKLAIRARTSGLTAADVDAAMDAREVVVTWVNRGTLHLMDRADHPWLLGLTAPGQLPTVMKRLRDHDVEADLADTLVDRIVAMLEEDGPLDRRAIATRLEELRRPGEGLSAVHALGLTGLRGLTVRGPVVDGQQRYALTRDWLGGEPPPVELHGEERERALAEFARRYLRGHGPAGDRDLAKWSGLGLTDVRAGLAAIASELVEVPGLTGDLVALRSQEVEVDDAPARVGARLLPMWDEQLVGWRDRRTVVREDDLHRFESKNGIVPAVVLQSGRAVGSWRLSRVKGRTTATAESWDDGFAAGVARDVARECADVTRFEG